MKDSLSYTLHKKFRAKREASKQDYYARKSDILYRRHGGEKALFIVMFIIFAIFALSFLFPFAWVIVNSFKSHDQFVTKGDFLGFPSPLTFQNYIDAFTSDHASVGSRGNVFGVFNMLTMSVIIAGLGTLVTVFTSSAAAYVIAKYRFPGRGAIFGIVIFSLIVPIVGTLPSQIQLMENMGFTSNNITRVIGCIFLYSGGFGMNFMLLYSFFKNLSWTYVEAAKIDGASDFRIFFKIIIPMAKGPIIAISIIQLIGLWNDYLTPSIYLPDWPTIAVGMHLLTKDLSVTTEYTLAFALIVLALLPIILLFTLFSKTIMENTTVGGLKG